MSGSELYPWDLPGYREAMDAAQDAVSASFDSWWEYQVAEMAVDIALPIVVEALARRAEREDVRDWLLSQLTDRKDLEPEASW